jgi:hypothetical protein
MVIQLQEKHMYLAIIVFLMGLQVYQWYVIRMLKNNIQAIWTQLTIIAMNALYQSKQNTSNGEQEQSETGVR